MWPRMEQCKTYQSGKRKQLRLLRLNPHLQKRGAIRANLRNRYFPYVEVVELKPRQPNQFFFSALVPGHRNH
jgi:hypothetical protein